MNKYTYLWVVQGKYVGLWWEDLCASEVLKEARDDIKAYRENMPETQYRLIQRRELNKSEAI